MCLIALAWRVHPRYRLVVAANRDEFHARPTLPLAYWNDAPAIVGGRDGLRGGSWLAIRGRRFAAVTNVRRPLEAQGISRGELVANFVSGDAESADALGLLADEASRYSPFNLLVHDGESLAFATNIPAFERRSLAPGVHGVSNGPLDAPWPKVERVCDALRAWLDAHAAENPMKKTFGVAAPSVAPDIAPLFEALADTASAPDARLPDTGVGLERERFLSPAFIAHAAYGTRASTVVLIAEDHAELIERRFGPDAEALGETRVRVAFA